MRKLLSLVILICCYTHAAFSNDNVFSLDSYTFERGETKTVYLDMDWADAYGAFTFKLYLPEGVIIDTSGNAQPKICEDGPWGKDNLTLSCVRQPDGSYMLGAYKFAAEKPQGGKGRIIEMNLKISADAPLGPATVDFKEIIVSTVDGRDQDVPDIAYDAKIVAFFPVTATSADDSKGSVELVGGGGKVESGTEVTVTATAAAGYDFESWTSDGEEVSTENPYKFAVSQAVALVGNFKARKYDVTFVFDNGTDDYTQQLDYGSPITKPKDPVKTGHTFGGWNPAFEEGATVPVGGVTYTAVWTVNSYKLTYTVDGKTYKEESVAYGTEITAEADPEKEGHTFSGWEGVPETMPAKDVVVTGSFTVNSYQAVFKIGDDVVETKTIAFGEKIATPEAPAKEGYTFSWQDVPETMPAKDIELIGVYTANSYKLTYTVDGKTYKEETITYGTEIEEAAAPEKEGYTFSGWEGVPETMPAKDVVVTGSFTVNSYQAVFKIDGEVIDTKTITFGDKITTPEVPAKEGYTFSWQDVPETMPAKDIEITGVYTANSYKLTYTVDGETYKEETITYGTEIEEAAAPEKEGNTFSGWEGIPKTMPARDVVVTGSFTVNSYKAVFKIDGEVIDTKTVNFGEKIATPEAPAKDGYTFDGWQNVPETMPAKDIEITGSYTLNQCVLTYIVDGEVYKEISVKIGAEIKPEPAPEKEGYTFSGWEGLPATMPDKDVTVNASFTVNRYRLSLYLNGELFYSEMVDYGYPITIDFVGVSDKFKFEGWQEEVPEFMPAHDVELHGTYTITSSISSIDIDDDTEVTVYNLSGQLLYMDVRWDEAKSKLESGVYIINGVKRRIVR